MAFFAASCRARSMVSRASILALSIAAGWEMPRQLAAEITAPTADDRRVVLSVASKLRSSHLLRRPIDDEVSERALKMFLEQLDPSKSYFLQSDIDEFQAYKTRIDDMVRGGDISAAYAIFTRFLQRVDGTAPWIQEFLHANHDFTLKEDLPTDPDTMTYAADEAALKDLWRRRIKFELLRERYDLAHAEKEAAQKAAEGTADQPAPAASSTTHASKTMEEAVEKLSRRYNSIVKRRHQTDGNELLELFVTCITSSLDPHTSYMSKSTLDNFEIQMRLDLEGIGAALRPDDGYTVVSNIIPGGPAEKHGKLEAEDRIVAVGPGETGEMVDVVDMKLDDVVKLIRGRAGTVVRIGVIPHGGAEQVVYTLTRAKVELKDSEARSEILEEGKKADGSPVRVGVIDLPSFYMDMEGARLGVHDYKSTTRDVRRILEQFTAKNVDVVVLDLRRNGGGSLTEAIGVTGLFIDRGPVVQVRDPSGLIQRHNDTEPGVVWGGPLVVVCGKFSASASEIVAGAIQDYQRGIVIGDESTHGKGTVQTMVDLGSELFHVPGAPKYGALKITIQQFYRPSGESTQKRGVLSDVVLPSFTTHMEGIGEGDLDYAIEFDQVKPAPFTKYGLVSGDILTQLRNMSGNRISQSHDFQRLNSDISKYLEQRKRKSVTLNESEYTKQREEIDADREDEKQFEDQTEHGAHDIFERNYYNNEIVAISVDYLKLLTNGQIAQTPVAVRTNE